MSVQPVRKAGALSARPSPSGLVGGLYYATDPEAEAVYVSNGAAWSERRRQGRADFNWIIPVADEESLPEAEKVEQPSLFVTPEGVCYEAFDTQWANVTEWVDLSSQDDKAPVAAVNGKTTNSALVLSAAPASLKFAQVTNTHSAKVWLHLYDATEAPANSAEPDLPRASPSSPGALPQQLTRQATRSSGRTEFASLPPSALAQNMMASG